MSFGPEHYVPVLKVKRGEKRALRSVSPMVQSRMTPLLEIVERKDDKSLEAHLRTAFAGLAESVLPYTRCFLDAREIASDGPLGASAVFDRALAAGISFTPVTGISREVDIDAVLEHRAHGTAIRLTREEFEAGGLTSDLHYFLSENLIDKEEIDLIVDLGPVDDLIAVGVMALADAFLAEVPNHTQWRTLTLSACAFPATMSGVGRLSHALVQRADWAAWRQGLHMRRLDLPRLPTFSDCAIQHPTGVEGFDPRIMQVSASIRYALPSDWILIKGESTRATPARVQFPTLATHLVYGHLRNHFAGTHHCAGCAAMKAAADGASGFGSPEVWRRLGTVHHITRVIENLAALPSP